MRVDLPIQNRWIELVAAGTRISDPVRILPHGVACRVAREGLSSAELDTGKLGELVQVTNDSNATGDIAGVLDGLIRNGRVLAVEHPPRLRQHPLVVEPPPPPEETVAVAPAAKRPPKQADGCTNPACANAFSDAASDGTALVQRGEAVGC